MNNHFKIIIPLYNVEKWIKICIRSVRAQSYKNFQCIILDDLSTDKSVEIIRKEIAGDDRFKLTVNNTKAYALRNIYDGINLLNPDEEDIIITVDGDDWLANKNVLQNLNDTYNREECWLTYGSYAEYPKNTRGKFAKKIPQRIIDTNSFRSFEWCTSHLRTFKYHLWNRIDENDLLDSEGKFYRMTWDLAFMFPMLEMSGNKAFYIKDIMYIYNIDNPLNDHKVDNTYQQLLETQVRNKAKYNRLLGSRDPINYMTHNRFDLAAKTFYAEHKVRDTKISFHEEMYLEHLAVWNNFNEKDPIKETASDFVESFDSLLEDISTNDYLPSKSKIPIFRDSIINGAHRLASCIVLNKQPTFEKSDLSKGQFIADYSYFKNKKDFVETGLQSDFCDEMALEFCRRKNNLFTLTLFPSHDYSFEDLHNLITTRLPVIYKKDVVLTDTGAFNYVENLYHGESWLGTNLAGVTSKASYCFTKGNKISIYLFEDFGQTDLVSFKEYLRSLCKVGKHSIHINDTQEETWRIASSVFNNNSIHFLNTKRSLNTPKFNFFEKKFHSITKTRQDYHDFCVDSSAVLSAYGLRDCRDLDFLHLNNLESLDVDIDCHNSWAHHYRVSKNEIIYNPRMHFYSHGVKFASLDTVREMKKFRNEIKDRVDVQLMEGL